MVPDIARIDLAFAGSDGQTAEDLFDIYFPTEQDKVSPEGMARRNLLRYVEKLQKGGSDVVVCEEEESGIENCHDESNDGQPRDEECNGDESSENESDEDIFEDATDHS